ncbi:SPOR domain-containing protein [Cohnella sp. GCM10020058]|uniref:SPOR domain-containing protein n=1 Tax=Cohnella sp. GCM10020058 TaxID=3317330 RepID=UPI003644E715
MQPTSRMTFKFDGNLPREVRNDSAVQQDFEIQDSVQRGANAALAEPAVRGFRPRGFSAQADKQTQNMGSGFRLPGKGAHIGQARSSADSNAADRPQVALAEKGSPAAERAPRTPFGSDRTADRVLSGNVPAGQHPSSAHASGPRPNHAHPNHEHPSHARLNHAHPNHARPNHANPSHAHPNHAHPNQEHPSREQLTRSSARSNLTRNDLQAVPYQDDVEALEQMIRGSDRERGHLQNEGRSVAADPQKTGQPGRVAGFRKSSSWAAPLSPALSYEEDRQASADPYVQNVYPLIDAHDPYSLNQGEAYSVNSLHTDSGIYLNAEERWVDGGETRRYRGGPSWMRIFASIAAAIVTGAIFGYIVLALFTGEPILPSGSAADPASAGLKPAATGGAAAASGGIKTDSGAIGKATDDKSEGTGASGAAQPNKTAGAAGDAEVPASVSYLLQYGVFQSEASMNEAVQALTNQGIAAATDTTDGFRVYAGIAADKSEAEKLGAVLTDEELYAKALENRALSLPQTSAAISWAAYLEESDTLGRLLAGSSAELLARGGKSQPSEQSAADLQAAIKRWKATTTDIAAWSGSRSKPAGALATQLGTAAEQWTAYAKIPSAALLRTVQASVMKAALIARQLREELGEDGD